MTEPTHVDTAIGIDKFKAEPIKPEHRTARRQTFRRTCQHYVTNNNTSTTPTVTVVTNGTGSLPVTHFDSLYYAVFDQGFVNIPFTSTSMAMDAAEWDEIQIGASKFRIVDCGFQIARITCSQQTIQSTGATTTVSNQFTQAPTLILVKDRDHVLSGMGTTNNPLVTAPSNCDSINIVPGIANKSFAHTFSAGLLPKVVWLQACGLGTVFDQEISFDIMKGGEFDLLSTGDKYTYHWQNPDEDRWQTPFFMGNQAGLNDETVRNTDYYNTSAFAASVTAALQYNLGTDVIRNLVKVPCAHFIRVPPLLSQLSPLTVTLELWIEYSMTVEWIPGRYLTTRALTGGDGSALAGNMIPFAEHRRGILAYDVGNPPLPGLRRREQDKGTKRKEPDDRRVPDIRNNTTKPQLLRQRDQTDGMLPVRTKRYVEVESDED